MMRRHRYWWVGWVLAGAALALPAAAQTIEAEKILDAPFWLEQGIEEYNSFELEQAITTFEKLIRALRERRASGTPLTEPEQGALETALEYLGRCHYNLDQTEAATARFTELLRENLQHALDPDEVSARMIQLYQQLRDGMSGLLSVSTDPPDCELFLDGAPLGTAPLREILVYSGSHTLEARHQGYDPLQASVEILPGGAADQRLALVPNSRDGEFLTAPPGVEVYLDGELIGTTSGAAGPEVADFAHKYGFRLEDLSAPFPVRYIPRGPHRIAFRRDCYRPLTFEIEIEVDTQGNFPLRFKPIRLERSLGTIQLQNLPPGVTVTLDGQALDLSQGTRFRVCAGAHRVEAVRQGVGRWFQAVDMVGEEEIPLDVRLRPTVVNLGCWRLEPTLQRVERAPEPPLTQYNLVTPPAEEVQALEAGGRPALGFLLNPPSDLVAGMDDVLRDLGGRYGAELILVGAVEAGVPDRTVWSLYSTVSSVPDRFGVQDGAQGLSTWRQVAQALERPVPDRRPWLGLALVDTALWPHPAVAGVASGGPAAQAGVGEGDRLLNLAGRPVGSVAEYHQVLATLPPGQPAAVQVQRGETVETRNLTVGVSPVLLPVRDAPYLYNAVIAQYRLRSRTDPTPFYQHVALLQVALALMHQRDYRQALSYLEAVGLPQGVGISRGTVRYLQGLCYLKLGAREDAQKLLYEAAFDLNSTVESNDGPRVSTLANLLVLALK